MMIVESIIAVMVASLPFSLSSESNSPPSLAPWSRVGVHNQQSIHSILASLEERLRSMDNMRYGMARWEVALDSLNRRIDTLESRITRAHSVIQLKIDSLSETVNSCELKDDLARDQLTRKFESVNERLMHKIGYIETRLETAMNKLQGVVETGFGKLETRTSDFENELAEIGSTMDEFKSHSFQWEEKSNQTLKTLFQQVQNSQNNVATYHQADKIANLLHNIHEHVNKAKVFEYQNNGPSPNDNGKMIESVKEEIKNEAQHIGKKVNNMYEEFWRKIFSLEELVRTAISTTNITRMELHEEMRSFLLDNREADTNDNFIEVAVDSLTAIIQRKLNDLGRKVENNFQRLQTAQNMFMETCHRIQDDESQLESKVSFILEKILDTMLNKTNNVDKRLLELLETLKGHNNQVIRTVSRTTNMVATLAEESSQDHKQLDGGIYDLNGQLEQITSSLQEIQERTQGSKNESLEQWNQIMKTFTEYFPSNKTPAPTKNEVNLEDKIVNFDMLNALNATYDEGVVNILTEIIPSENVSSKSDTKLNRTTVQIPLFVLNKTLEIGNITAIISEPNLHSHNKTLHNKNEHLGVPKSEGGNPERQSRNHNHRNVRHNGKHYLHSEEKHGNASSVESMLKLNIYESTKESNAIMVLYLRLLKGDLTKSEFLKQSNPSHPYKNIEELIKSVKNNPFFSKEFLADLERWDAQEGEKSTDYNYEDLEDDY